MKTFNLLLALLLLLLGSSCKQEEFPTRISGRVLEAGSLQHIPTDSLRLRIIDGYPCGYPCFFPSEDFLVAELDVVDGRYDYSFTAKDDSHHWVIVKNLSEAWQYDYHYFEIFPGQEQVRNIIRYRKTELRVTFHNKNVYPQLESVFIGGTDQYVLPLRRFSADTVTFPYQVRLPVVAGHSYELELLIYYGNKQYKAFEFTEEIPYDKPLSLDIDL